MPGWDFHPVRNLQATRLLPVRGGPYTSGPSDWVGTGICTEIMECETGRRGWPLAGAPRRQTLKRMNNWRPMRRREAKER
jgi:hypothetical protein